LVYNQTVYRQGGHVLSIKFQFPALFFLNLKNKIMSDNESYAEQTGVDQYSIQNITIDGLSVVLKKLKGEDITHNESVEAKRIIYGIEKLIKQESKKK